MIKFSILGNNSLVTAWFGLILLSGGLAAQTGLLPVNLQGRILDLTGFPPYAPIPLTENSDPKSGKGPQVVFDLNAGNVVFFSTDPNSKFFNSYPLPGDAGEAFQGDGVPTVSYPPNALYFFSSINDNGDGTGTVNGSGIIPAGLLSIEGGPPETAAILYGGSIDNPLWLDESAACGDGYCADMTAPLYNWADLVPGDAEGCNPIPADKMPQGRFVIMTRRLGCDIGIRNQNVAASGAIAWIIYDDQVQDDLDTLLTGATSAGAASAIPIVLIHNTDGQGIIRQLHAAGGTAVVTLHPTNPLISAAGSYSYGPAGELTGLDISFMLETAYDTVFAGRVTKLDAVPNLRGQFSVNKPPISARRTRIRRSGRASRY